ncbi:glycosidase PH1107-related [Catenulispora acidiphila DSM 44928]|uniref:Glycosidase PH1107-related n=1 Tax=Catenulispora acidiphila (strain DSM 44928 / JCM 14897 / NBRC 102108 / NRRL B-24433 / ID139908) TaxID=479433 RepID=C7Q7N8_CATAD|nr:glycoside hydrolase family 130 protein [Catenulispora acidiphila]ACU72231.1 glycosidase PH1107-related [Catenulispora acidiphila DSM 44928]
MTTAESVPAQSPARGLEADELVTRRRLRLNRDPSRVIAKLFLPGGQPPDMNSRAGGVVRRVLTLSDVEVEASYTQILEQFGSRHRDLQETFAENYRTIEHRVGHDKDVSEQRRLLIGAHFTHEYAIEGAALTNPSMVPHPDQSGLRPGELRFLMSARAIGEGHLSCVEFRTGVIGSGGELRVDQPSPHASIGSVRATRYERSLLAAAMAGHGEDDEVVAYLLRHLPEHFTDAELEARLGELHPQLLVQENTYRTVSRIHWFLACQYRLEFSADADVSEHVLWPQSPTERRGVEDARFVRCVDPDGSVMYRGTYTAYSGSDSATQLMETPDFQTFQMSQLFGPAVGSKGLALFPRQVEGRHVALSRWDPESNAIATSQDGRIWQRAGSLDAPLRQWELTQVGNCGSPIETEAGWLALTHGVGPMRTYALGAILLDLKDPTQVVGTLRDPLLIAAPDERDGYVPNVVYSCGALKHEDLLVIPYGFGDMGIEFATVSVSGLLERLEGH